MTAEFNNTDKPLIAYQLEVRLNIRRVEKLPGQNSWRHLGYQEGNLSVEEEVHLGSLDFMGVLLVLAKLHEAVNALKSVSPE